MLVAVYVGHITVVSKYLRYVQKAKEELQEKYGMTDGGEVNYLLGIQVERNRERGEILLHQQKYVDELLEKYPPDSNHGVSTPLDPKVFLSHDQSPTTREGRAAMAGKPYREVVGSLMYLNVATGPNIAAAISRVSL